MPVSQPAFIQDKPVKDQKFEALFQNQSLGILIVDQSGNIISANNFLLSEFGYSGEEELIGKKVEVLIPMRFHKHHVGDRKDYTKHPESRPMGAGRDLFGVKKTGEDFPVEVSLSSYTTNEAMFVIAFVTDITTRKEIEKAMVKQQEELAAINRTIEILNRDLESKVTLRTEQLQQTLKQLQNSKDEVTKALGKEKELSDLKSRFVSMASHEFRTPLSTILSSASLLAKYTLTEDQDKRDRHIDRIKSSVNNLTNILNEFLSIGKIEDGKITINDVHFNVKEFFTILFTEMNGLLKLKQKIVYQHKGVTDVLLDPSLLKNVLINLLSNAIKFSRENSNIKVTSEVNNGQLLIKVKDDGIGMSQADQQHLFERFFRGANAINIQGTGLGLHIVGKYIELMNGEIDVKSDLEKGTEINLKFSL